jgi:hypothetical protein
MREPIPEKLRFAWLPDGALNEGEAVRKLKFARLPGSAL